DLQTPSSPSASSTPAQSRPQWESTHPRAQTPSPSRKPHASPQSPPSHIRYLYSPQLDRRSGSTAPPAQSPSVSATPHTPYTSQNSPPASCPAPAAYSPSPLPSPESLSSPLPR